MMWVPAEAGHVGGMMGQQSGMRSAADGTFPDPARSRRSFHASGGVGFLPPLDPMSMETDGDDVRTAAWRAGAQWISACEATAMPHKRTNRIFVAGRLGSSNLASPQPRWTPARPLMGQLRTTHITTTRHPGHVQVLSPVE